MDKKRYIITILIMAAFITKDKSFKEINAQQNSMIQDNLNVLISLENQDISTIEVEIKNNQQHYNKKENTTDINYKEIFENSVVMGDSQSEGLTVYDILNSTSVVAYKGSNIVDAKENMSKLKNLNPENVFLLYGMNDVLIYKNDLDSFIKDYSTLISDIKEELPNTKIYINAILPVTDKVVKKRNVYNLIDDYNEKIKAMCEELEVGFVDASYLLKEDNSLFEGDGMHLKPKFYPLWLKEMANEGDLK